MNTDEIWRKFFHLLPTGDEVSVDVAYDIVKDLIHPLGLPTNYEVTKAFQIGYSLGYKRCGNLTGWD